MAEGLIDIDSFVSEGALMEIAIASCKRSVSSLILSPYADGATHSLHLNSLKPFAAWPFRPECQESAATQPVEPFACWPLLRALSAL